MSPDLLNKLQAALDQFKAEVEASHPGSDANQLALFDLIYRLRNDSAREPALVPFHEVAKKHVDSIMAIVETGKGYTEEQVKDLHVICEALVQAFQSCIAPAAPAASKLGDALPEEKPLVMDVEADGDILKQFVEESYERLDAIEQGILDLEKDPTDREALNLVFRAFHNLKGGSGFLNLMPIHHASHELESLLDKARNKELVLDHNAIELILKGGDTLKQFIVEMQAQLSGKKPPAPILLPTENLKSQVRAAMDAPAALPTKPAETLQRAPAVSPAPKKEKEAAPAAATTLQAALKPGPAPALPLPAPPPAAPTAPVATPASTSASPGGEASKAQASSMSVKVDTLKLDSLVDLVGELVIAQSFVAQFPQLQEINNQFFTRSMSQLSRITKELQRTAMSMRMIPIGGTFQKMMRIVRDVSAKQNKNVRLVLSGEETELDRTIVEEIGDPLMHMIRNSVDHGIEAPDVRTARSKPAQGTIHLRAFHQGGNIVIQIEDDGNGLNRERIFKKAVEKGLISESDVLSDAETYHLIFAAGFSTAETVTDVSGRGVGMDVVKRNIEKLQGKIEIESEEGKGTTFTIYLPLTLAIIEALVVSVAEQRYVIPALSVRESFQLKPEMVSTIYNRGEMVKVRDRLIPLLRLNDYFNITSTSHTTHPEKGIIIVLEAGRATRCILVDRLLHKQEVVIKSLGPTMKRNPALAGAAILGDGRVGLILDVNALVTLKTPITAVSA